MASDQRAGDLLSASLFGGSGERTRGTGNWLEGILGLLSGGLRIHGPGASEERVPIGVVVRWRADGRELLRLGARTASEAEQLLESINAQLRELSVEEFCARWE